MSRIAFPENPTPEEVEALINALQRAMQTGAASPLQVMHKVMVAGAAALESSVIVDPAHLDHRYFVDTIHSPEIGFYPAGGGFRQRQALSWLAENFEEVRPDQIDRPYRPACVSIDADPENESFPCYLNGDRWNGFDMPCFTHEVALKVARMFNGGDPVDAIHPEATEFITYDAEQDAFVEHRADDEPYSIKAEMLTVDGQPVKVYGLGAGSWCWSEIEPEPTAAPKKSPSVGI